MSDPSRMSICYIEEPSDFAESVASYDRKPLVEAMEPLRQITFSLRFPFAVNQDDIIIVEAYSEGREIDHRFYDGPPPEGGRIIANLPAKEETGEEVYWMSIALIRVADRMTCGWSMEEKFVLPTPPHPAQWDIDLLSAPEATDDGGSRLTRISPG